MMETTSVCGMEAATRGLVEGSSSPPASVTTPQDNLGEFGGLINSCCNEEVRGETPGREDCQIDPLEGELDSSGDQNKDQNMFGGCYHQNAEPWFRLLSQFLGLNSAAKLNLDQKEVILDGLVSCFDILLAGDLGML